MDIDTKQKVKCNTFSREIQPFSILRQKLLVVLLLMMCYHLLLIRLSMEGFEVSLTILRNRSWTVSRDTATILSASPLSSAWPVCCHVTRLRYSMSELSAKAL
ncbi:hypothetical protein XENORESO_004025 [Xenotaenia resolanae]|uniref:Uncharacterized protein n=1 Tax=Xenotaenia resolanae TaxID=208358 RepID=A0ABV0VXI6_9TELE